MQLQLPVWSSPQLTQPDLTTLIDMLYRQGEENIKVRKIYLIEEAEKKLVAEWPKLIGAKPTGKIMYLWVL